MEQREQLISFLSPDDVGKRALILAQLDSETRTRQ